MVEKGIERLREVAERKGWKALMLDVDDTVCPSSWLWVEGFAFFARSLGQNGVAERVAQINDELYPTAGVHPRKYGLIARKIAGEFGLDENETLEAMKGAVARIYLGTPQLYPETGEVLRIAEEAGLRNVFVTHSPVGRIRRMMTVWGLWGKVPVFIESTLRKKGPEIWRKACSEMGAGVMAGDNLQGDVVAAGEAGIKDRVWIRPKWKKYGEGEVPEGVPIINGIGELVQALIAF